MSKKIDEKGNVRTEEGRQERPFGWKDKIGYLFGDFGNDFSFVFASNYLMVFYTKVLGLSGFLVGLLFMGARIVDAFTDVTMGRIVDHMQPARDGRFRPWIRRMCIPEHLLVLFLQFSLEKLLVLHLDLDGAGLLFFGRLHSLLCGLLHGLVFLRYAVFLFH